MNNQLYPHNKAAYERVMKAFKTSNRTCICHPTGTGKSYIVAAVCQHFERVLVIAPNMFVLNQQKEALVNHKNVSYMTYPWLMLHYSDIKNKYDIIILDEFHRAGAEEWGAAVNLFLESQTQAKVLGTTATPIRYLDNGRDMAKELFDSNIASTLSIAEAWHQNILPIPTYVTGFFSFDNIINDTTEKIKNSKRLDEEEKSERLLRISNMRLEWQKSSGMGIIIKKHLNKDVHRIIVFCAHIGNLQGMQLLVKKWFRQAGFRISGTYMIHSDQNATEQLAQMKEFSQGNVNGVKLLFVINILNEGVHIPNVDAVLMLRTTSSRIIYLQQLGRCLTAANTDNPLVLDMVDNISTTIVNDITEELAELEDEEDEEEKKLGRGLANRKPINKFKIFDYTLDIRQMVEKLVSTIPSLDERIEEAIKFCESNGRAPSFKYANELSDANNWKSLRRYIDRDPRVFNLFVKYGDNSHLGVFKQRLLDYIKENNTFPSGSKNCPAKKMYFYFWSHKETLLKDPEISTLYNKYNKTQQKSAKFEQLKQFCKTNKRLPSRAKPEDKDMYIIYKSLCVSRNRDKRLDALIDKYKRNSFDRRLNDIISYTAKNGCLPHSHSNPLYRMWQTMKSDYKDNPKIQKLLEEYGEITKQKVSEIKSKKMKETRQNKKAKSVNLSM